MRFNRTSRAQKALAQEFHDRFKAELWRISNLGEKPRRTWNEAVVRWLKEKSHKATARQDVNLLRWLDPYLGGKDVTTINRAFIDRITEKKLATGCSNATANRHLALVRAILRKCAGDWEWSDWAPKVRMLRESKRRIRFLPLLEPLQRQLEIRIRCSPRLLDEAWSNTISPPSTAKSIRAIWLSSDERTSQTAPRR